MKKNDKKICKNIEKVVSLQAIDKELEKANREIHYGNPYREQVFIGE